MFSQITPKTLRVYCHHIPTTKSGRCAALLRLLGLMLFPLSAVFPCLAQSSDTESLGFRMDTTFLENYEYPLGSIEETHLIHFQTKSVAYLKVRQVQQLLENNSVKLKEEGADEATLSSFTVTNDGYLRLELPPGRQYELLTRTTKGNWKPLKVLDTRPGTGTEMIAISEQLNEALYDWQEAGNQDLYTFLMNRPELSVYERFAFMQDFLKKGAPLSDLYIQGDIPQDAFIVGPAGPVGPGPGDPGDPDDGDDECGCRVLNINGENLLTPHGGDREDLVLQPAVHDHISHKTQNTEVKEFASLIGPARYQEIEGTIEAGQCSDGDYFFGQDHQKEGEMLAGEKEAVIKVRQVCADGNWEPGDCYCTQKLTFNYRYDSRLHAYADTKVGMCTFQFGPRTAYAIVQDVVGVYVTEQVDFETTKVLYDTVRTGMAYAYCERDFDEGQILNLFKLGFEIYLMAKGEWATLGLDLPEEWEIADTLTNQILDKVWKEYRKTNAFKTLEKLLTKDWVVRRCESHTTGVTLRPANSIPFELKTGRELAFRLSVSDYMAVGGEERWRSTGRLRSGFAISVLLEKWENIGQENEYCCTKPAGIYQTESFHPLVSESNYKALVGTHLNDYLGCCFPISPATGGLIIGDNDRAVLIADELPNCATTINGNLVRDGRPSTTNAAVSIQYAPVEDALHISNTPDGTEYELEVFSIDGRRLTQSRLWGDRTVSLATIPNRFRRSLIVVRLSGQGYSATQKIFLP